MERVFSAAFSEFPWAPEADDTVRALIRVYRDVIAKTTDPDQFEASPDGPIQRLLKMAIERAPKTTLITFNQDLVIERALDSLTKGDPGLWSIAKGYGKIALKFTVPTRDGLAVFPTSKRLRSRLSLLKLHGSLNWYVPARSKAPRLLWNTKGSPRCTSRKSIAEPFNVQTEKGSMRTWPVIVPPVIGKGRLFEGILHGLWQQARDRKSVV